jgi:hypothetical protein
VSPETASGHAQPVSARTIALGVFLGIVGAAGFLFLVYVLFQALFVDDVPRWNVGQPATPAEAPPGR